jgi:hypothetical protein
MALTSDQIHAGGVKLGKLPARHDPRTLQLAKYLKTDKLPEPPKSEDFSKKVAGWPMMKNDTVGDCTCAAAGHMIEQWTTYANKPFTPTDTQVIDAYSAITGYNPKTGAHDNGANMLDVLNYWRKTGIAGRKIVGYVALEPKNQRDIEDAIMLFGNVYLGVALPLSAQRQTVWAVPPGGATGTGAPGSWGGHAVPVVQYDQRGLTVVTWGQLKRMTWSFLDTYCDEAFAVLSDDWINDKTKLSPDQFDVAALQQDLAELDSGKPALMTV